MNDFLLLLTQLFYDVKNSEDKEVSIFLPILSCIFFVLGVFIGHTFSSLFYSLGLISITALVSINCVPLAEWVGPFEDGGYGSKNKKTLYKLIITAVFQLVTIYYTSIDYPFLGAIVFGFCNFGWLHVAPQIYNGDAAGNGMARGCGFFIDIALSVAFALFFYIIVKFIEFEYVLPVCMALMTIYFLGKVIGDYRNRTVGRYAEYRKNLRNRY